MAPHNDPLSLERNLLDYLAELYAMHLEEQADTSLAPDVRKAALVGMEALSLAYLHASRRFKSNDYQQDVVPGVDILEDLFDVISMPVMQMMDMINRATAGAGPKDIVHICRTNGTISAFIQRAGVDESARQVFSSPNNI